MIAEVKQHNGTPTLFMDGKPVFASYLWHSGPTREGYEPAPVAKLYAEAGIHYYAFDVGAGGRGEWSGPGPGHEGHYDFSGFRERMGHLLDVDPDARIHLRMYFEFMRHNGAWWHALYPDELEIDSDGQPVTQSFASTVWREQCKDFIREYVRQIQAAGLEEHFFAFQTGAGHTGEWCKGLTSMRTATGDYSAPMRRRFRAWLWEKYGDDATLRGAWADPNVTLDTAEVPPHLAQITTTHQSFRDPRVEMRVVDYYECLADLCADLIIDFNRTVKEATDGTKLAGAFYGYILEMAWNAGFFSEGPDSPYSTLQRAGHLGLAKVLRSPHVDFLVSPYAYGFRGIGGHGPSMPPSEVMRIHGKLYLYEEDSRTHLAAPNAGFGNVESLPDAEAVLKRNLAEVLTRGQGIWWLGNRGHIDPVSEPTFAPLLKQFQRLGTFALELDRRPSAEVAVIIDDESLMYESLDNALDIPLIFQQRLWGLPRMGAPVDYYMLRDLLEGRVRDHKLYIFMNAFHLDRARRDALAAQLRRDGKVALWIYAPGYLADAPGLEHMTDLTGITYDKGDHMWGPLVHIVDFEHPITRGLSQDLFWGTNSRLGPVFHVEDPEARVLGQVVYSQGRCKPGFVIKEFAEWTSIYVAAPNIPANVLRGIARFAGAHIYSDEGDVLYAAPQLLSAHTVSGGERVFSLPAKVEVVYDLFEGKRVAANTDRFEVTLAPRSTALYYAGEAELDGMLNKLLDLALSQQRTRLQRYDRELREFEKRYGLGSAEFYRRFEAGEMGDSADLFEWAGLYELEQDLRQKIDRLEVAC